MSKMIVKLADGTKVRVIKDSHVHEGMTPRMIKAIAKMAHRGVELRNGVAYDAPMTFAKVLGQDMGYIVGKDNLVKLRPDDVGGWYHRDGRKTMTHGVLNRQPEPTKLLNFVCGIPSKKLGWCLYTIYPGMNGELEVGDPRATAKSAEFWATHALIPANDKQRADLELAICEAQYEEQIAETIG